MRLYRFLTNELIMTGAGVLTVILTLVFVHELQDEPFKNSDLVGLGGLVIMAILWVFAVEHVRSIRKQGLDGKH